MTTRFSNFGAVIFALALWLAPAVSIADEVVDDGVVEFELPDLRGEAVQLSDFRGRWVVVNFWATWCGPCIAELPVLQAFHDDNAFGAMVLGVNFEQIESQRLIRFVTEQGLGFPIVRIGEVPLVPFEPLLGIPSTFLVSPEGRLVYRHTGPVHREDLDGALSAAGAMRR